MKSSRDRHPDRAFGRKVLSSVWSGLILTVAALQAACASAPEATDTPDRPAMDPGNCVIIEVQNISQTGVSVWVEWQNRPPRRLARIGLNERRVFTLPFQNNMVNLRFQPDGSSMVSMTNALLPTPGVRFSVVYRVNGAGPLRRVGHTRCP